jgi:hypothetical protein
MQIFDQVVLLSQALSRFLTLDDSCTIPAPFNDVTGTCISINDCSGFSTPGLCPGAADIQVRKPVFDIPRPSFLLRESLSSFC